MIEMGGLRELKRNYTKPDTSSKSVCLLIEGWEREFQAEGPATQPEKAVAIAMSVTLEHWHEAYHVFEELQVTLPRQEIVHGYSCRPGDLDTYT